MISSPRLIINVRKRVERVCSDKCYVRGSRTYVALFWGEGRAITNNGYTPSAFSQKWVKTPQ